MTDIPDIIKKMAADDTVLNGSNLFKKGAILDIRPDTKGAAVRMASRPGKFESVHLTVKFQTLISKCSCGVSISGSLCAHGVAAALAYQKAFPQKFDYCFSEPTRLEDGETVWSESAHSAEDTTQSSLKKREFRDILRNFGDFKAELTLRTSAPPKGESRWHQISLKAEIVCEGKLYSSSNIRRILDLGDAAGGIKLDDFPPQDQMIMRYLTTHADRKANAYKMNAHILSGFFHCLTDFPRFFLDDKQLHISSKAVMLFLDVKQLEKGYEVQPALKVDDQGMLNLEECSLLAGTSGYWICMKMEYFWLPGVTDVQWVSGFLSGENFHMNQEDFTFLRQACEERVIPVEIELNDKVSKLDTESCVPIMTLDWNNAVIQAKVFFEYGNYTSVKSSSTTVWNGENFVIRDKPAEEEAYQWLLENNFDQQNGSENTFYLNDFDSVSQFLLKTLPELSHTWKIYFSEDFSLCARHIRPVQMKVRTKTEAENWVDINFEFQDDDQKIVEWQSILKAVNTGRELIQLNNGQLVRLDSETSKILKSLPNLDSINTGVYRFSKYMSLMMNQLLGGYIDEESAPWQELSTTLLNSSSKPKNLSRDLNKQLRTYQKNGIAWLQTMKSIGFNCILADEMGLGKTIQALSFLSSQKKARKDSLLTASMVICPKSLIDNWGNEAGRFTPELRVKIIAGSERTLDKEDFQNYDLLITSYALVRRDLDFYSTHEFENIILDEAQNIKNHKSQTSQACRSLNSKFKFVLSGTPVENSVKEIWSIFDFLLPGLLGTMSVFKGRYDNNDVVSEDARASSTELATRIKPFILRRMKKNLLKQLPPKQEQILYCELDESQKTLYAALARDAGTLLDESLNKKRFTVLALLLRLRQVCCHPALIPSVRESKEEVSSAKFELLKELIYEIRDSSHRVLIFSQFTSMLKIISQWLKDENIKFEYLDGGTNERQQKVDRFNEDESIPVFLLSLKAGGTGLNLTGADTVIHYDMWWNPQVEDQATDRTHRIGQTKAVNVIKLVAKNSIEEKILTLQKQKRKLFENLMDGIPQKLGDLTQDDLKFLLTPEESLT